MEDKQKCRMETMFKSALDKVTDCILAVSLEGNLLYVNKQFIAIHGLDKDWHKYTVFDLPVSFNTPEQFAKKVEEIRQSEEYIYIRYITGMNKPVLRVSYRCRPS